MKHVALVVSSTLLVAGSALAEEALRLRYVDPVGSLSLHATHEIELRLEHPIETGRTVEVELSESNGQGSTIEAVRATSVAHGTVQRLPTRHLAGQPLTWTLTADGCRVEATAVAKPPTIPLGPMVPEGLPLGDLIAGALPMLPEQPVTVGSAWTSEQPIRSLEGWGWGAGALASRHRVTAIDHEDGHAIVHVQSEGAATLDPEPAGSGFRGKIERELSWTFDATAGRVLTMTLHQESDGAFGDKRTPMHQRTRLEWKPATR